MVWLFITQCSASKEFLSRARRIQWVILIAEIARIYEDLQTLRETLYAYKIEKKNSAKPCKYSILRGVAYTCVTKGLAMNAE